MATPPVVKLSRAKQTLQQICPPLVWKGLQLANARLRPVRAVVRRGTQPGEQDLSVYWEDEMVEVLETWGEGNVWNEIQLLLCDKKGKVLDVACGSGKTMSIVGRFPGLDLTGCDISDRLIAKAVERGIPKERLVIGDATKMPFADGAFDHAYSIGSLEHFTEEGITACASECRRVTTGASFHQVPTSRSGKNDGWIKRYQSYYNNSVDWWLDRLRPAYPRVEVLPSVWGDADSVGKWFVCWPT